jgi:hypothetical protein
MHLFLGGRDRQKLEATQEQLRAVRPDATIDILAWAISGSSLEDLLYSRRLNLVVHLAGPFQGQDYAVAVGVAAIAAWFSLKGLVVLFRGSPIAIVVMGALDGGRQACGRWLAR